MNDETLGCWSIFQLNDSHANEEGGGVTNGFEICSKNLIFAKNIVISLVISLVLLHPEMIQNAMNHDS